MSKGFKFMIIVDSKLYLIKKQKFSSFSSKKIKKIKKIKLVIKFDNFRMNYI